jgi:hypothetical protein
MHSLRIALVLTGCLFFVSMPSIALAQGGVHIFKKVDYFQTITKSDGDQDEQKMDARLEIDTNLRELNIVHEKNGASQARYAWVLFDDVTSVMYERSKSPRVKTAIFLSPLALFSSGKKHWLTIEWDGGYAYMRLDKKNQRQIRAALNSVGFDVEVLIED